MVRRDQLPDTFDDLLHVRLALPEAVGESDETCPVATAEIREYLAHECPGGEFAGGKTVTEFDLKFARTATVEGTPYWLWLFKDEDGADSYILVRGGEGRQLLSYDETYGMTPEQIIVKEHFDID